MKSYVKKALAALFLLIPLLVTAQESRTIETRVADLLARLPAQSTALTDKLMEEMIALGDKGMKMICDQLVPAGTGDDTGARFAIESLSRYLSQGNRQPEAAKWETACISALNAATDNGIIDFYMKQLQLVGGDASAKAVSKFLNNKDLCAPAVSVLKSVRGDEAAAILAASLKSADLKCAAAVMNALASKGSAVAVNEYITWSQNSDLNIRAAALNALAMSGSPLARDVLLKSAAGVKYIWEGSGATASLLNYAKVLGGKGDIAGMDRICKLVMSKCDDKTNIQGKIAALEIFTGIHGSDAMPLILKAASHPNEKYRKAALNISLSVPGSDVTAKWIKFFEKAGPEVRPAIISMLGQRGDKSAIGPVREALNALEQPVRTEAAAALAKLDGKNSVAALVDYLRNSQGEEDRLAARNAIMTVAGTPEMKDIVPLLKDAKSSVVRTAVELVAWNADPANFSAVFALTGAQDEAVKKAAVSALPGLVSLNDQEKLIDLLSATSDGNELDAVRAALAAAASKETDPEKRAAKIITYISSDVKGKGEKEYISLKMKLIPVLSKTGGREALELVLKEFNGGNAEIRDVCFSALAGWKDHTASSALCEICASGNKTFESKAFEGYVRQVRNAPLPDEQKLLLFRKIMPLALTAQRKNSVIAELGRLNTYQALFFVAPYLDNPETSSVAAKAAMLIALPSVRGGAGLYGDLVRNILTKARPLITGMESDYDKEMITKYLATMSKDPGFTSMFNGRDLTGWQGLVDDPVKRAKMSRTELERRQAEADMMISANWSVKDGCIVFSGEGNNLCSVKQYGDFEMLVDWKITRKGDSGIYLRGSPQVQIWDTSRTDVGAQVGSGGLYNNQKYPSKPLKVADNPVGDWNTFRILMIGEKVSVWLNGDLVVDNVILENYWNRNIPIFPKGAIELQAHGTDLAFRDIYVREISDKDYNLTDAERAEGFVALFNGRNLDNWTGNKTSYVVEDGNITVKPGDGSGGNLYTADEYSDFVFRFEFMLTPGANNGLGIRTPLTGDAAYVGMEIQILDNTAPVYANLQPYQYHGSVYGVIPARREFLKPLGEWNYEEVRAEGTRITVTLNGALLVDGDIAGPRDNGTMDHREHPGLKNTKGHIGFLGHGSELKFRNIRIKDLAK